MTLTQNTLGCLISKPRLLTDRLRKPPFRFLFDVASEVARQTGFGVAEMFGGEITAKPTPPASREEKVNFLKAWISLASQKLGGQATVNLEQVNADNIVCGIDAEWTNFLLQCTAAAAWPSRTEAPRPPRGPELTEEQAKQMAEGIDFSTCLQTYVQIDEDLQRTAGTGWRPNRSAAPSPSPGTEGALHAVPEAQGALGDDEVLSPASPASPLSPLSPAAPAEPGEDGPRPTTAAQAPLNHAYEVRNKVDEEMRRAQELMEQMEGAIDRDDEELQKKRELQVRLRAEAQAARNREAEAQAELKAARERQLQAELMTEQEREAEEAKIKALMKAERKAAKAKRRAEREAEAAKAKAVYPVSKTAMEQGARMIASLPTDAPISSDEESDAEDAAPPAVRSASPAVVAEPEPQSTYVDAMSGCFTEAILGPAKEEPPKPAGGFDFAANEAAFYAQQGLSAPQQTSLLERLKGELKETYLSYLFASMPESLMKKYNVVEIIGCLQFLLKELRECLKSNGLDDVDDEEPTTMAEELREKHKKGWLVHLQTANPGMLRHSFDESEVIDTLQSIASVCSDRLNDEIGHISLWAPEDGPLRKMPDVPMVIPEPEARKSETPSCEGTSESPDLRTASEGRWSPDVAGGSHGQDVQAARQKTASPASLVNDQRPVPPATAGGSWAAGSAANQTSSRWGGATASRAGTTQQAAPERAPAAAPVFTAVLGPAPWEVDDAGGGFGARAPATAGPSTFSSMRAPATANRTSSNGPRPPMGATAGAGFSSNGNKVLRSR